MQSLVQASAKDLGLLMQGFIGIFFFFLQQDIENKYKFSVYLHLEEFSKHLWRNQPDKHVFWSAVNIFLYSHGI